MRSDTVDIVKGFFKLDENGTTDLLSAGVGEGLLLVGEEVIPIKFKPSQLELDIIKGNLNKKIASAHKGIKLKHEGLNSIVSEQNIIFQEWMDGDDSQLQSLGYEPRRVQRAVGPGMTRVWIKTDIIEGESIHNQSIDHYCTIGFISGYLAMNGIPSTISHHDGADITFETGKGTVFIEYEHGTQNTQILQQKKQDTHQGMLVFVGNSSNIKYLYGAVGEKNTYKRGQQLADFLDSIIESNVS